MDDNVLKNLSYPLKKKTEKIIIIKNKIDNFKIISNQLFASLLIMFISLITIVLNLDIYDSFCYKFIQYFNNFPYSSLPSLKKIYCIIFIVFLISAIFSYYLYINQRSKLIDLIDIYKMLRIDIITSIDNDFCKHEHSCDCKERYYKLMERMNIDLIIK